MIFFRKVERHNLELELATYPEALIVTGQGAKLSSFWARAWVFGKLQALSPLTNKTENYFVDI